MAYSFFLSILICFMTITSGASLICYQCDDVWITPPNLKLPTGCLKMEVNHTYCTMSYVFYDDVRGYVQIKSESGHEAYHYDEDFALLGLTMRSNGSFQYGVTYHCVTDGCNQPDLDKIKLLFSSTTIDHNTDRIVPLLYTTTPSNPVVCSNYTNYTDPSNCYKQNDTNMGCSRCFTKIDGATNGICANCLGNIDPDFDILGDERAYLLKTRTTENHFYNVHCNIRECNTMENIQKVQKLHRYDFDYDKFMRKSISSLLFINRYLICFQTIFVLFLNCSVKRFAF